METLTIILLLLFIPLAYFFIREKNKTKALTLQIQNLRGETDDEMYGRGKFSELGLMSAGITHEISNPLSIITGRVTQLMRHTDSPEIQKGLKQIEQNADRIAKIIQGVREYIYRNDNDEEDYVSLKEIIDDVMMFYGQRLKNHGIDLRIKNIDKIYIRGSKGQFEQAILNLISNSFDAIDNLDEKWIEISASKVNDHVQIFIKDSGLGIPLEVREKMLEPFFSTKKGKGSGLGLSLVRGIAHKNGGEFKYIPSQNTTFMLDLPEASDLSYHH